MATQEIPAVKDVGCFLLSSLFGWLVRIVAGLFI